MSPQARRQDLAAGGPKTRWRGQKPEGGATFLKYGIGCMAQPRAKREMGGTDFKWGGGHHWRLYWRRPCVSLRLKKWEGHVPRAPHQIASMLPCTRGDAHAHSMPRESYTQPG